jgi:DNA-binding FrmR family transcriptional regulator
MAEQALGIGDGTSEPRPRQAAHARVRRMKGQVEALEKALSGQVDCTALLTQVAAVRGASHGLMAMLLSDHLRHHLAGPDDAASRELAVDDIASILRRYPK